MCSSDLQPSDKHADVFMRIYNPDGSEAGACGNATRCVASLVMDERKADHVIVQTISGLLDSQKTGMGANGLPVIAVDMGEARLDWREIPVAKACDTNHLPVGVGPLRDPVGTNMGNPHATFFVDDALAPALDGPAAEMEKHPFFPEKVNVGLAQMIGENRLRLRVYERGTGFTLACGSGACAAGVAAARRGLTKAQRSPYERLTDPTDYAQLERMLAHWGLTFPPGFDAAALADRFAAHPRGVSRVHLKLPTRNADGDVGDTASIDDIRRGRSIHLTFEIGRAHV